MNSGRGIPNQMTRKYDDLSMNLGHTAMSYRCSFCKRDFSNAQALGGHMNIHRKDRAKLKEFSDENLFSLDIFKTVDLVGENSPADPDPFASEETKKAANSCDDLQDVVATSKHNLVRHSLVLFAETTSISDENNLEKNNMELIHGEVDLELRLGP